MVDKNLFRRMEELTSEMCKYIHYASKQNQNIVVHMIKVCKAKFKGRKFIMLKKFEFHGTDSTSIQSQTAQQT
jgi:hypothetical protein